MMGWVAGAYGITTNIGLITTVVDNETIKVLNGKVALNTSVSNTATNNNVPLIQYVWVFE